MLYSSTIHIVIAWAGGACPKNHKNHLNNNNNNNGQRLRTMRREMASSHGENNHHLLPPSLLQCAAIWRRKILVCQNFYLFSPLFYILVKVPICSSQFSRMRVQATMHAAPHSSSHMSFSRLHTHSLIKYLLRHLNSPKYAWNVSSQAIFFSNWVFQLMALRQIKKVRFSSIIYYGMVCNCSNGKSSICKS